MKNIIKSALVLAFVLFGNVASAACWANSRDIPAGTPPVFLQNGQWCTQQGRSQANLVNLVPVGGTTTHFVSGPNVYNCPALAGWGGGLIGAILGNALGQNATTQGHRLGGLGAVAGAVAGNQIACEWVRPAATATATAPAGTHENQGVLQGQTGGVTTFSPSDCDVGAVKDQKGLSEADCKRLRDSMTVHSDGHCRVAGVNYPHLVDNPLGCQAKRTEIANQGNSQIAVGAGKPVNAADVKVNTSTGTPISNACAWVNPDTKQRFDKPSTDGRPCVDFVKEVAGNNGHTIAFRQ